LSITNGVRQGMASALIAATGLVLAAFAPAAHAAAGAPASSARPGLHISGKAVRLGKANAITAVAETPADAVYFALGHKVYEVSGTSAPVFKDAASGPVLALAATNSDVFIETGLTVFEYSKNSGFVRQWKLSSPVTPITSAGLVVSGSTVWSWTDWATDSSGFEFATVSEFSTSSAKVRQISKSNAYPGDMAADPSGVYYEATLGTKSYLVLTAPSGATKHRVTAIVDSPVALSAGRADLLTVHTNLRYYVASYRASNLAPVSSKQVTGGPVNIAGTTAGLLVLRCSTISCSKASVGVLNTATGSVSAAVSVANAYMLLAGPPPAVLTDVSGNAYLVRLAR
jgi:hypothetical protein